MVSLVIVAGLLTATAVSVHASLQATRINSEQSEIMQAARLAVNRLVVSVRTTRAHAPTDSALAAQFASGTTVQAESMGMFDECGADVVYRYDRSTRCLMADINGTPHVLARGVQAFSIRMEPMRSAKSIRTGGGFDLLRRATMVITIAGPSQSVTMSGAAAPRQNVW